MTPKTTAGLAEAVLDASVAFHHHDQITANSALFGLSPGHYRTASVVLTDALLDALMQATGSTYDAVVASIRDGLPRHVETLRQLDGAR